MCYNEPVKKEDTAFQAKLKKAKTRTDRFDIINSYLLVPMLAELTNQTGLIHTSNFVWEWNNNHTQYVSAISLKRKRPKRRGILNWLARLFSEYQEVLRIEWTGQMWSSHYWVSYYFMTAQRLRDEYYEKLKETFEADFVIVGND